MSVNYGGKIPNTSAYIKQFISISENYQKDPKITINKLNNLFERIQDDKDIHKGKEFWNDISSIVLKIECLIFFNLAKFIY